MEEGARVEGVERIIDSHYFFQLIGAVNSITVKKNVLNDES